jgi:hypothetical protein
MSCSPKQVRGVTSVKTQQASPSGNEASEFLTPNHYEILRREFGYE